MERWGAAVAGGDEGVGAVGRLEVVVQAVLQRWRGGPLQLPDYLLVVDADRLGITERHWYLSVLAGAAPHRVVGVPDDAVRWCTRCEALAPDGGCRRSTDCLRGSTGACPTN